MTHPDDEFAEKLFKAAIEQGVHGQLLRCLYSGHEAGAVNKISGKVVFFCGCNQNLSQ